MYTETALLAALRPVAQGLAAGPRYGCGPVEWPTDSRRSRRASDCLLIMRSWQGFGGSQLRAPEVPLRGIVRAGAHDRQRADRRGARVEHENRLYGGCRAHVAAVRSCRAGLPWSQLQTVSPLVGLPQRLAPNVARSASADGATQLRSSSASRRAAAIASSNVSRSPDHTAHRSATPGAPSASSARRTLIVRYHRHVVSISPPPA